MKSNEHTSAGRGMVYGFCAVLLAATGGLKSSEAAPPVSALATPRYSFDLASPTVGSGAVSAGSVLEVVGMHANTAISSPLLMLTSDQDDLDALSAPLSTAQGISFVLLFSVDENTIGNQTPDPGAVTLNVPYNVWDQSHRGHQAGDLFLSTALFVRSGPIAPTEPGNNVLAINNYDEGGVDFGAQPPTSSQSNVGSGSQDRVDATMSGTAQAGFYFSASRSSPSLADLSAAPSGADVFRYSSESGAITLYAAAATLGLQPEDDIDALIVFDSDQANSFGGWDQILFSLAPGSPSLSTIPEASLIGGAADVFVAAPGQMPALFVSCNLLGLGADADNVDALELEECDNALVCASERGIRGTSGNGGPGNPTPQNNTIPVNPGRGPGQGGPNR